MGIFNNTSDDKNKTEKDELVNTSEEKSMKDLYADGAKPKKEKKSSTKTSQSYRVLVKPMVTEKATNLSAVNQYVFMVDNNANKIEVAKAVFDVYGVKPLEVNIIKVKGKKVNRGRITGKRKDFKKAIVSLKKGDSISVYEGV